MALILHTSHSMALQPWKQMLFFSIRRAVYPAKIPTRSFNAPDLPPFTAPFTFSISPNKNNLTGHGLVFIFVRCTGIQYLGFLNRSDDGNLNNHAFAIEFDVFKDQEFNDINNDNDVAVGVNSVTSLESEKA
ncbi:hypothetical protein QUC31_012035 [Theobroma cacao]